MPPPPPQRPVRANHTRQLNVARTPSPPSHTRSQYTQQQQRIYRFAANDGPQHSWRFVKGAESSDANVAEFQYHLQRAGRGNNNNFNSYYGNRGGSENAWIQEFSPQFIEEIGRDVSLPDDARLKLKASLGKCHFLLRRLDPRRQLDWRALQSLRVKRDFVSRWSNICDQNDAVVGALVPELESKLAPDAHFKEVLTVHIKTPLESKEVRLKYHRVDGQWELLDRNSIAKVLATHDVLVDNAAAFRVRVSAKLSGEAEVFDEMVRHFEIDTPPGGELFDTTVALSESAAHGYHVESFSVQRKVYVVHGGLRYMLAYLDRENTELRLECRLARPQDEEDRATKSCKIEEKHQQEPNEGDSSVHAQCQLLVRRLLAAIGRP